MKLLAFLIPVCLLAQGPELKAPMASDPLFRAMKDELARSLKKLQLEQLEKPYFIAYRIVDTDSKSASATFGALTEKSERRSRLLSVEVRVGSYERDNTNFFSMRLSVAGVARQFVEGGITTPLDDNYDEIRRQLWIATDSAYKQALDDWAKKKGVLANRNRTDDAPDFSREDPLQSMETAEPVKMTLAEGAQLVTGLSGLFRKTPAIDNSSVALSASTATTRYLNSEGTAFMRVKPLVRLTVAADTQAADGMPLSDSETILARQFAGLPGRDALAEWTGKFAARMTALRTAGTVDRYTGPVLFEKAAAAELLGQTLADALAAQPRLVVDNPQFERMFDSEAGGLRDRLNTRLFPATVSLVDDATRKDFQNQPLFGSYEVDDEGVRSRVNSLVERGMLKGLLNSRALVGTATKSTGSRRTQGTLPGNLILSSTKTATDAELKSKLIEMVKENGQPFGVLVRKMANPTDPKPQSRSRVTVITFSTSGGGGGTGSKTEPLVEAYKVFPDGREELIRNAGLLNFSVASFKDIAAVGADPVVYTGAYRNNRRAPVLAGPINDGSALVSVVTPSLLFTELTLQKPVGEVPKLPFAGHPMFGAGQ